MNAISKTMVALWLAVPLALVGCSQAPAPAASDTGSEATAADTTGSSATDEKPSATDEKPSATDDKPATTDDKPAATDDNANVDDLVSWGIKVAVPDGCEAVLKGEEYYIYTETPGKMPYVLLTSYTIKGDETEFINKFTDFMKDGYADLQIAEEPTKTKIGDKDGWKFVYTYGVEGHETRDTRFLVVKDGRQYVFGTKEIADLGISAGDTYEKVISDAVIYGAK